MNYLSISNTCLHLVTPAEFTGSYLGCYKDRAEDSGGRALSGAHYIRNDNNSIERCLDFCSLQGNKN